MWPDRVSNPGPLTYESGALPIALRGPALLMSGVIQGIEEFITGLGIRGQHFSSLLIRSCVS